MTPFLHNLPIPIKSLGTGKGRCILCTSFPQAARTGAAHALYGKAYSSLETSAVQLSPSLYLSTLHSSHHSREDEMISSLPGTRWPSGVPSSFSYSVALGLNPLSSPGNLHQADGHCGCESLLQWCHIDDSDLLYCVRENISFHMLDTPEKKNNQSTLVRKSWSSFNKRSISSFLKLKFSKKLKGKMKLKKRIPRGFTFTDLPYKDLAFTIRLHLCFSQVVLKW